MKPYHDIPVFIVSFNRLKYLRALVSWLEASGYTDIRIVDNASTYPPLLSYLYSCGHTVHRMDRNFGHLVVWESNAFSDVIDRERYVVTDCDVVPDALCPLDAISYFSDVLDRYPDVTKVGFGLRIDDLPDAYVFKRSVTDWESCFWTNEIETGLYDAPIDTTFALYRPGIRPSEKRWWKSIRTGFPYVARHLPWYESGDESDEESRFYQLNLSNRSSFWSVTDIGLLRKYGEQLQTELDTVYGSWEWKILSQAYRLAWILTRKDRFLKRSVRSEIPTVKDDGDVSDFQNRNTALLVELDRIRKSGGWELIGRIKHRFRKLFS
ncbi:MAG: glycosyltransferase family 2 protein [Candidatus Moranbacteria bacterium]|nr:glycosyltransferase family 2 protein [Candidatus Moranbacteria bacterium]